jgi:F-type H+-transporting ATPase subunit b
VSHLLSSVALLAAAAEHEAETFLGLPLWIWQLANLAAFLAVLGYLVARPLAQAFRRRQEAVEERIQQAKNRREEAARLESQIHERMARLDRELAEVRARGVKEGEEAKAALLQRAEEEAERVRREAQEEIARRLAFATEELRRTAADLTAAAAIEKVSAEITEEDRRRLLADSVGSLSRPS